MRQFQTTFLARNCLTSMLDYTEKNLTEKRAIPKCCLILANNDCLVPVFLNLTMESLKMLLK